MNNINFGKISLMAIVLVLVFKFFIYPVLVSPYLSLNPNNTSQTLQPFQIPEKSLGRKSMDTLKLVADISIFFSVIFGILSIIKQTGRNRIYGIMGLVLSLGIFSIQFIALRAVHGL